MKRTTLIASLTAAVLAAGLLAGSPALAHDGRHAGSSGYRIVFDSRHGLTYFSGQKTRRDQGVRHGHRYTHKFRHHHQKSRHDRRAWRQIQRHHHLRYDYRRPVGFRAGGRYVIRHR